MKNIGLIKYENADINNFTSDLGIKIRRTINRPLRFFLRLGTSKKIVVDSYPNLEKGKPYIFASTHSCVEEVSALLGTIDRSAYSLMGTTDQLEHNPAIYANWVTGFIFVNRLNNDSRKSSLPKMERIINSGSSILLFPEGGWNNTESLLCQKLFSGVYNLSKNTGALIVPISTYTEFDSKSIYINAGDPVDITRLDKKEGLAELRDILSTLKYEQIEKHSTPINRAELSSDARERFMEERKNEYLKVKWSKDVWDEELTMYKDKDAPSQEDVRTFIDSVNITSKNAFILAPILVKRIEDKKYDFKDYMHKNWNNSVKE